MMVKVALKKCSEGNTLTQSEAKQVMDEIMRGEATEAQIASILSMLRIRKETVAEMIGFATSMREHATTLNHSFPKVIDTCGTGGDGYSTFNISTATAIVLAACGLKVAKHGNKAVSSKSGSADVLEALQIPIQSTPENAVLALEEKGLCFLFAPLYHQSMKYAANTRRELGFRTVFNILGPLVNPAKAQHQMIGVFDSSLAEKMARTLLELGIKRALFVTGGEGLDECSISTHTNIVEIKEGELFHYRILPEDFGLKKCSLDALKADNITESAKIINRIFCGKANEAQSSIVSLNAGVALYAAEEVETISEGVKKVQLALATGDVFYKFQTLQQSKGDILDVK